MNIKNFLTQEVMGAPPASQNVEQRSTLWKKNMGDSSPYIFSQDSLQTWSPQREL